MRVSWCYMISLDGVERKKPHVQAIPGNSIPEVNAAPRVAEFHICVAVTTGELVTRRQPPSKTGLPDAGRVVAAFRPTDTMVRP